ncbi:malate synthase [Kineococcus xinjiangensis]|uniref:Malate synthase n=1 Tax=Kineococcus xinjiangensis TaxID=512762 RepID=A0A2S6IV98_9ACTN|nr:malate synthase A [Kineococcus xinjiangensis]PPK98197.1 malate synthase [Kineococcus xinjiangensis]
MDTHPTLRTPPADVQVHAPLGPRYEEILTPAACEFLGVLDDVVAPRREELLRTRRERRRRIGLGQESLDFRRDTQWIRDDPTWSVPPAPADLVDRRVEITGPPTRKMTVNALNSGADGWMADFEDATTPTWGAVVEGQLNLVDALDRRIDFTDESGRRYELGEHLPTIHVRPRGWHLVEKHLWIDGRPLSASVVDAGLYLFHCARRQLERGSGPYLYLPKLESAAEARLWNTLLLRAQELLGLPAGTVRVTVLVETLPAAFEMEEILYELRPHATALNAGRWDYLFSVLKTFSAAPEQHVLPDRSSLTMETPFLRAYTELLVRTCHRRGAHAIGGMAAFVPDRRDPERTRAALERVRGDKEREARDGFDGSWVAHPGLVATCREVFDQALGSRRNQLLRRRCDVDVTAADLLDLASAPGQPTAAGLRSGISVALRYLQAWLAGSGAVTVDSLMEDAATVEIVRSQVWQQVRARAVLDDGTRVGRGLVEELVDAEAARLRRQGEAGEHLPDAVELFLQVSTAEEFVPFFTTPAYGRHIATPTATPTRPEPGTVPGARPGPARIDLPAAERLAVAS